MTSGSSTWTGNGVHGNWEVFGSICKQPPLCKPSRKHVGTQAELHLKSICFQTRKRCFWGGQPQALAPGGVNAHGGKVCLNKKVMGEKG